MLLLNIIATKILFSEARSVIYRVFLRNLGNFAEVTPNEQKRWNY